MVIIGDMLFLNKLVIGKGVKQEDLVNSFEGHMCFHGLHSLPFYGYHDLLIYAIVP